MDCITFWNGLHTIGSNIFSLDNGKNRVIMDFGMPDENYDHDSGMPAAEALISAGKLPKIPYLFDTRQFTKRFPGIHDSEFQSQAVFVSHLHLDHNSGLKYLPEGTDVYMSEAAKNLYDALLMCGMEVEVAADLHGVPFNETVQVGDYSVSFIENDHDTIGSAGILIEGGNQRILHSGDVRKNGYHPGNMETFIEQAQPVDLLMIEGTSFSFLSDSSDDVQRTERDLLDDFTQLLIDEDKNIVINPYPRNIERLTSLNRLSIKMDRPIYWDTEFSKLLKIYTDDPVHTWTDLEDTKHRVIQLHFSDIEKISGLSPGTYIHMNGEPLGDYDPRYEIMQTILQRSQFEFKDYSVSGHASKADILTIAESVNPQRVVPWHTFEPEKQGTALRKNGMTPFIPKKETPYLLSDILKP